MKNHRFSSLKLFLAFVLLTSTTLSAQQPCQPPALSSAATGENIFSAEQEMDLGDAVAAHLQRSYRVIEDPAVTTYLRLLGERLIQFLPPTGLRYQFFLVDISDVNAFTLPGGRIYMSRKMVAFAQNEDELAGVVAHELGHIAAHHSAIDMTLMLKEVLGVTQVGDRRDIFEKYNQLIENAARKPRAFEKVGKHEEGNQDVADLIGLYALTRAGYDSKAQVSLWDRLTQTQGKTGNFFSDLFGTTRPEQKRLGEMLKGLSSLPPECRGRHAAVSTEFARWQTDVVSYTATRRTEKLPGLISKKSLTPALHSDIGHLRFSADGKYLLAQDDSGINVLTRTPFKQLFRINAPNARPAQFNPSSDEIVFNTSNQRVEVWDLAAQKLKSAKEMVTRKGCVQTALSPDAKALACLDSEMDLNLFDVASGELIFKKKAFHLASVLDALRIMLARLSSEQQEGELDLVKMGFSADARYFLAGDRSLMQNPLGMYVSITNTIGFDLGRRADVPLTGDLKRFIAGGFAFVGPDKIVGVDWDKKKTGLLKFPGGTVSDTFDALSGALKSVTDGDFVLVKPIGKNAAVYDLVNKKVMAIPNQAALDVYNGKMASERRNGELALYDLKGNSPPEVSVLPQSTLGRLYAYDLSADFRWLALSGLSRGAVWDLEKGERLFYVRGFRGAYVGDDGVLYADFPPLEPVERNIAHLNLVSRDAASGASVTEASERQFGSVTVNVKPAKKGGSYTEDVIMDVKDARTLSPVWSVEFPRERPGYWIAAREGTMTLTWPVSSSAAKEEVKNTPILSQQLSAMKERAGAYYLKVLDLTTGKLLGQVLIETGNGSFRISRVFASHDWVVISDSENRVLVYSLEGGREKGRVFGSNAAINAASNLLCVDNGSGKLTLYDLTSFEPRAQLEFPGEVSLVRFSTDGKRLLVLTDNQDVFLIDTTQSVAQ
jgi:WD40 repeat protein